MLLHLSGSEDLNVQRETAYKLLTDAGFLAKSLPDASDIKVIDDSTVEAKMKVGVAFVNANMQMRLSLTDKRPSDHARLMAEGSGSGSTMKITSDFDLAGEKPTKISWSADAEITGLIAGMGSNVLKGFSEKKVAEIFRSIKDAMEKYQG